MNSHLPGRVCSTIIVVVICLMSPSSRAGEATLDAETQWAEVERLQAAMHVRPEWQEQRREPKPDELSAFQTKIRTTALELAKKARAFATRFPTNESAGDARFLAALAMCRAVAAGDAASEAEVKRFEAETLADLSIPENERIAVMLGAGNLAKMKKLGMKLFTEPAGSFFNEHEESFKASAREIIRRFPTNGQGYSSLLAIAQRAKEPEKKQLAQELIDMELAPAAVKTMARHILAGTKPFQIGKPVEIDFTALDGRKVDLAKLRGKVVLVDFWATDCGPCVAEMPEMKAVYDKFHDKGFEIIGISLDSKEVTLRRFIRDKNLPWPQHFDGNGWENRFAQQFGIFSIPTVWLVDRRGNLAYTETRGNLKGLVENLVSHEP